MNCIISTAVRAGRFAAMACRCTASAPLGCRVTRPCCLQNLEVLVGLVELMASSRPIPSSQAASSNCIWPAGQQHSAAAPAGVVPLASQVITPDMEGWVPSATTSTEAEPDHLPSDLSQEPSASAPWSAVQPPADRQPSCTDLLLTGVRCQHTPPFIGSALRVTPEHKAPE